MSRRSAPDGVEKSIAFPVVPLRDSTGLASRPDALHRRAAADGYLYVRGLIDAGKVAALRARALAACRRLGFLAGGGTPDDARARPGLRLGAHDDSRYHAFLAEVLPSPEFAALRNDARLLDCVASAAGRAVRPRNADICRAFSPDTEDVTTEPHQDHHYLPGETDAWAVWVPLTDCPLPLGPLAVAPGSHRAGPRPHVDVAGRMRVETADDDLPWAAADLSAGDAILFHCLTLHRALPNRSASTLRLSADFRFLPVP